MEDLSLIEWGTSHFDDFLAESSDQELRDFLGQLSTAKQLVYGELINRAEKKENES